MRTFYSEEFSHLQNTNDPIHLAIGMFDGLHVGHQAVIGSAIRAAGLDNGLCGILTFDPHPSHLFRPEAPTPQIYPPIVKEELLRQMGLDLCLIQNFNREFAKHSAEEFVSWIHNIIPSLASLSVGENFRFGKGRAGDPALLVDQLRSRGISVFSCERVHLDGEPISSTRIRSALPTQPIEQTNHLLGRPYHSIGIVREGKKLGRTIGFPTLNLAADPDILPPFGVYLVRYRSPASTPSSGKFGIANFGLRPTLEDTTIPQLEIHSLDDCTTDYGDTVVAEWIRFVRPERKFKDLDALKEAIRDDRETALRWIKK